MRGKIIGDGAGEGLLAGGDIDKNRIYRNRPPLPQGSRGLYYVSNIKLDSTCAGTAVLSIILFFTSTAKSASILPALPFHLFNQSMVLFTKTP